MTTSSAPERISVETNYGTVSNIRVTFYARKWLLGGKSVEDLPMRHITAVRLETVRHWIWGTLLGLIGLALLASKSGGIVVGIILVALAALLIWGWPKVVVNTAGGDLRPSVGMPWTRGQADEFVTALRRELVNRG
jgi:hypothetical protein